MADDVESILNKRNLAPFYLFVVKYDKWTVREREAMIIHEYVLHFNESTAFLCKSQTTLHQFTVTPLRVGGCAEHQRVAEGSRLTNKCSVNNEMRCSIRLLSEGKRFSPRAAACGGAIAFIKRAFCFTGTYFCMRLVVPEKNIYSGRWICANLNEDIYTRRAAWASFSGLKSAEDLLKGEALWRFGAT